MERRGCDRSAVAIAVVLAALIAAPVASGAQERHTDKHTEAGDVLQILLPAGAFAATLVLKDWEGSKEFVIGGAVALATVHGVKYVSAKQRPDESTSNSFPSGHTAAAFYGPAFIHRRYGMGWAAPLYLGAMYVGFTRVHANRHWADDVFFGATTSLVSNWIFTSRYSKNVTLSPDLSGEGVGFLLEVTW